MRVTDEEARLIRKLQLVEAIYADTDKAGERVAAGLARDRILARLKLLERQDPPVEYQFSMQDPWKRKLFMALLRRYGIASYRYYGQRRTTVMARVSKRFVDETLWPEFNAFSDTLTEYLSEVTDRVLKTVLQQETSADADEIRPEQLQLA